MLTQWIIALLVSSNLANGYSLRIPKQTDDKVCQKIPTYLIFYTKQKKLKLNLLLARFIWTAEISVSVAIHNYEHLFQCCTNAYFSVARNTKISIRNNELQC